MLAIVLTLITTAQADEKRHEVSLELASMSGQSVSADRISAEDLSFSGIRAGYGVTPWLTIIGSWNVSRSETAFYRDSYTYEAYPDESSYYQDDSVTTSGSQDMLSMFVVNQFAVGPKVDFSVKPWLHPYVTTQFNVVHGSLVLSDDLQDDDSLISVQSSSLGIGGVASAGVEFRLKPVNSRLQVASHLEVGGQWNSAFSFSTSEDDSATFDIGDFGFGGLVVRGGLGLRF